MRMHRSPPAVLAATLSVALGLALSAAAGLAAETVVAFRPVEDRKAVIATVEPVYQLTARARIPGTIVALKVREGDRVAAGAVVAVVADEKLLLQIAAVDARIASQQASRDQAKVDLDRLTELQKRGTTSLAQLDQARTAFDVAERNLTALRADRGVIVQQQTEGTVLAPAAGRILRVQATEGAVVLGGETIATLAQDQYVLRLNLPERHAGSLRAGDTVAIASRNAATVDGAETRRQGKVRLVYPEIQGGRIVADIDVEGLGDYFVGERIRVEVPTGTRPAMLVPAAAVYRRAGVQFVRLADGTEIVVQPGENRGAEVEILSGLKPGDRVVTP
jgi:RND family efflux transporter MFP subunit